VNDAHKRRSDPDVREVVDPLRRRKWLILSIVVLATLVTYVVSSSRSDRYRATSTVLVQNSTVQGILNEPPLTTPERASSDQAHLIASRSVAERVAERLGLRETPESLLDDVTATPLLGSNVVAVTAERRSGSSAAQVANAFATEFIALGRDQLKAEIDAAIAQARARLRTLPATPANREQREILRDGVSRLAAAEALLPPQGRQVDPATSPRAPIDRRPGRDALFALIIASLLAVTLAYALEWLGRSQRSEDSEPHDDAARKRDLAVHATTPHSAAPGRAATPAAPPDVEPSREGSA
jgi:capsular polysaccharide biosynthesis protein